MRKFKPVICSAVIVLAVMAFVALTLICSAVEGFAESVPAVLARIA